MNIEPSAATTRFFGSVDPSCDCTAFRPVDAPPRMAVPTTVCFTNSRLVMSSDTFASTSTSSAGNLQRRLEERAAGRDVQGFEIRTAECRVRRISRWDGYDFHERSR